MLKARNLVKPIVIWAMIWYTIESQKKNRMIGYLKLISVLFDLLPK